jgi:putative endonuclease
MKVWYLYVLETSDGTFYTGITTHVDRRVQTHNAGKGAKYTALRCPVRVIAVWETVGRANATRLERAFKQLSRPRKLAVIQSGGNFQESQRVL